MQNSDVVNEMKQLAKTMESLAHEVQVKLDAGDDNVMTLATELVRNNSTFVFTLGEMYALKALGPTRKVKARAPSTTPRNYHNHRNALGRFTRKV